MSFIKKALGKAGGSIKKSMGTGAGEAVVAGGTNFEGQTFLHGHLLLEVREARNLPDMEGWVSKLVDKKDVTDPFVDVKLGRAKLAKTS